MASLLVVGAFGAASCDDIIAGEHADVTAQLCKQLGDCYGDDEFSCPAMQSALREASALTRDDFLGAYDEDECLGSCPRSLACIDREPYCKREGACAEDYECCDWSLGLAACSVETGGCCAPRGVACGKEGDRACCDTACERGFCGGYECGPVGKICERGEDCCTRQCENGKCAKKSCSNLGDPCVSDDDCCNPPNGVAVVSAGEPPVAGCEQGACVLRIGEQCAPIGTPCNPEVVPETGACCGACVAGVENTGICAAEAGCFGPGLDCAYDGQCCADLVCDYGFGEPFCATKPVPGCGKAGDACMNDEGCCPGRSCSNDGFCSEIETPACTPTDICHSPCEIGAAMLPGSCAENPALGACVDTIIEGDSFCGCVAWDFLCTEEAKSLCLSECL